MTIRWTTEATGELDVILSHLQVTAPDVAVRLVVRIERAEQSIENMPRAARFDPATNTYDRYVPQTRIILTYAIQDDFIEIIQVRHTSRNPETKRQAPSDG